MKMKRYENDDRKWSYADDNDMNIITRQIP